MRLKRGSLRQLTGTPLVHILAERCSADSEPIGFAALSNWFAGCVFLLPGNAMLRITVQEEISTRRLNLSGKLVGPWVTETANVWRSLLRAGKQIEVDLNEVTSVDAAGRTLLASMHDAGARLRATGVENCALIAEIAEARERK